jgi:hypothetical protein
MNPQKRQNGKVPSNEFRSTAKSEPNEEPFLSLYRRRGKPERNMAEIRRMLLEKILTRMKAEGLQPQLSLKHELRK